MSIRKVVVNGRTLSESEVETLRMVLEMATIDLTDVAPDKNIEGTNVSEHLANVKRIMKIVGVE